MMLPERSLTELSFKVAKLRVRLRLVRNICFSTSDSFNSSQSSTESDSSSSLGFSSPSSCSPRHRCSNLSDHSVNANEEFNSFFSSPTRASSCSEEMLSPKTPMFEIAEDMASTHSNVKPAAAILLTGNREIAEEVESRTNFPTDPTATLPLKVQLLAVHQPAPPLPPRHENRHLPPKLPPKLKKRTRLFENIVF